MSLQHLCHFWICIMCSESKVSRAQVYAQLLKRAKVCRSSRTSEPLLASDSSLNIAAKFAKFNLNSSCCHTQQIFLPLRSTIMLAPQEMTHKSANMLTDVTRVILIFCRAEVPRSRHLHNQAVGRFLQMTLIKRQENGRNRHQLPYRQNIRANNIVPKRTRAVRVLGR